MVKITENKIELMALELFIKKLDLNYKRYNIKMAISEVI